MHMYKMTDTTTVCVFIIILLAVSEQCYGKRTSAESVETGNNTSSEVDLGYRQDITTHVQCRNYTLYSVLINEGCTHLKAAIKTMDVTESCGYILKNISDCLDVQLDPLGYNCSWYDFRLAFERNKLEMGKLFEVDFQNCSVNQNPCRSIKFIKEIVEKNCRNETDEIRVSTTEEERCRLVDTNLTRCMQDELTRWQYNCTGDDFDAIRENKEEELKKVIGTDISSCTDKKCFNYTMIKNITKGICPNLRLTDNRRTVCRSFSMSLLDCIHEGMKLRRGMFCKTRDYVKSFRENNTSFKEDYGENALQCLEYVRTEEWVKLVLLYVYTTPLDCKTGQNNQTLQNIMKEIIIPRILVLSLSNRNLCMNNDCPLIINGLRIKVKGCVNITTTGRKNIQSEHEVDISVVIEKVPKMVIDDTDGREKEVGQMFKTDFERFQDSYRNSSQPDMVPLRLGIVTCDASEALNKCVDEQGESVSSKERKELLGGFSGGKSKETTTIPNSNATLNSGNSSAGSKESDERFSSAGVDSSEQYDHKSCPAKCSYVCPTSLDGCQVTLQQVREQFKDIFGELTAWNIFNFMNCQQMYKVFQVYSLFRRFQPSIKSFLTTPSLITLDEFKTIGSIETILSTVIPNLKTDEFRDIFSNISSDIKKTICNLELGCISDTLVFREIADTCIDNVGSNNETDDDERSIASQYRIIEYMQQNKNISTWTCDDIEKALKFPDAISKNHIQSFSDSSILECADSFRDACKRIDIRIRKLLITRVKNLIDIKVAAGDLTSKVKRKLKMLIGKCADDNDDIVKALTGTKQEKLQILRNISDHISEMDDALKTDVKDVMFQSLIPEGQTRCDASGLSKENLYELVMMALDDRSKLKCFTDAQLRSVMCDIGANCSCSNAQLALLKRRVDLSSATKECKMKMISSMDETDLASTDIDDLKSAIDLGYIKKAKISAQQGISILKKMNREVFDKSTLDNLGKVKAFMKVKQISKIPTMDADIVKSFEKSFEDSEDETNSATREGFIKKALEDKQIGSVSESSMHKWLSVADFANAKNEDLANLFGDTDNVRIKCKKKAAPYLYKKVVKVLGTPKSTNLNWTSTRIFKFAKSCIFCGMSLEDIDQLPEDKDIFDTIGNLPCLSIKQEVLLSARYKKLTKVDGSQTPPLYSEREIKSTPPQFLSRYSETVLRRFGNSNIENVWKRLAKTSMRTMSKTEIRSALKTFLSLKGKQSGTINTDTLLEVNDGDLLCGMTRDLIERSNLDVIKKFLAKMLKKCSFNSTEKSTITKIFRQRLGMQLNQMTEKELLMFGPGLLYFTEQELGQLQDVELVKVKLKMSKMLRKIEKTLRKRRKSPFTDEIDEAEMSNLKTVKNKFFKRMRSAIRNTEFVRNRRRRSVDTVTCDDLKGMEDIASSLTVEQIQNIADADFQNCLNGLGKVTDYNEEQKLALASVAKGVYGLPSTWSEDMLISAGVIIQGLTQEEISTLQLTIDSIAVLGKFDDWDKAKKKAAVNRYLTLHNNGDTSTLTNLELRSFEHFACALDTTQIGLIQPVVYGNSTDLLGDVTSCEDMQYLEYGKLAKQVYGAVTTWESTTISVIGVMIAGLTKSDIPLLTSTQIEAISSMYIPYIPATTFSAFTPSQIESFSMSQALLTTKDQRKSLSSEQMMALEKAAGMTLADPTSGTKKSSMSTMWLFSLIIITSLVRKF